VSETPAHVHAGGVDHLGTWRGKRFGRAMYEQGVSGHGLPFSDVFWALTVAEDLVEPPSPEHPLYFPRKESGFPDVLLRPDPETLRPVPWLAGEAWAVGEWFLPDGRPVPLDPRGRLRAVLDAAAARGLRVRAGFEYEFYLLDASVADLAAGGFAAELPTAHTHPYTYSGQRAAQDRALLDRFASALEGSGLQLESANCETGQSQIEVNVRYADGLRAADDAFLFKQAVKTIAAEHGGTASFMAKPHADWAGSSCHVHLSLWSEDGSRNLFAEGPAGEPNTLARQSIGGLLATLPAATAILCPTVNSAKRLVPYSWAATTVSWGLDNRSTALRTIEDEAGLSRIEHRMPGADVNPYLALAAIVAGVLHGIEDGLDAPAPTTGDAYADPTLQPVPLSLDRALDALEPDDVLSAHLGTDLVDHLCRVGRAEVAHHHAAVSDWERRRYLELA
jgi:glutamine synthetase